MGIKLIAIGNWTMGDDGAALAAAEYLESRVRAQGIEVILGETDVDYCISRIEEGDQLIVLDASCRGEAVGGVWAISLQEAVGFRRDCSWQHDRDLVGELRTRGCQAAGLLVCIEIRDICFRWGLSQELWHMLPNICDEIYDLIIKYKGGCFHA